jgi:ribosomal protein RSM22 (predicted rRNA methylase)
MKTKMGLWIDHKKAVIVSIAGKDAEIKRISSNIEKHHRQSGVSMPADDVRQRELAGHLNIYYDEVVSCIRDADSILIFGPGEAKSELEKRLEKDNLGGRIVGIETSDKMTDPQIVAQVRKHFLNQRAATSSRSSSLE